MFKWPTVINECKYIVKSDDDIHIRAKKFTSMIRNLPDIPLYGGFVYDRVNRTSGVSRDVTNRHSFTFEEIPYPVFDPYAGGPLYFMSSSVARIIPYNLIGIPRGNGEMEYIPDTYVQPLPPLFKLEDAFLGSLIGKMSRDDVTFWHIDNFFASCTEPTKSAIAIHGIKDLRMIRDGKWIFR
jgi:hypothetical protein